MSIWFFTDPHIGVSRNSHTTAASRLLLKDAMFQAVEKVFDLVPPGAPVICLGDLFDTTFNTEEVISQGFLIADACSAVLAGNHDLANREGRLSSLGLLDSLLDDKIIMGKTDEPGYQFLGFEEATLLFVPHMATQELFERSLNEVAAFAMNRPHEEPHILCLHCNYASGFITNDASLNFSKDMAEALLETFDYILLGHEHIPRILHDGRLIILGNTHPTSFSDISDKFAWEFDGTEFKQHKIWDVTDSYGEMLFSEVDQAGDMASSTQFVLIKGEAKPEQLPDVAQNIVKLWKAHPHLLMVRNSVTTEVLEAPVNTELTRHLDLPTRISKALEETDLADLWTRYLGALA